MEKIKHWFYVIFFLLTVVVLPIIYISLIEPLYGELSAWQFLLFFVVLIPIVAKLFAQMISNRSVGFRSSWSTVVRQTSYESLSFYIILCVLAFLVLVLFMWVGWK